MVFSNLGYGNINISSNGKCYQTTMKDLLLRLQETLDSNDADAEQKLGLSEGDDSTIVGDHHPNNEDDISACLEYLEKRKKDERKSRQRRRHHHKYNHQTKKTADVNGVAVHVKEAVPTMSNGHPKNNNDDNGVSFSPMEYSQEGKKDQKTLDRENNHDEKTDNDIGNDLGSAFCRINELIEEIPTEELGKDYCVSRWNKNGVLWIHKQNGILEKIFHHLNQNGCQFWNLREETLSSLSEDFTRNQVYIAPSFLNGLLYRAKMIDILFDKNQVAVEFIDMGTIETIPIRRIYKAQYIDEFLGSIPPQYFKHRLGGWTDEVDDSESIALEQNQPVQLLVQHECNSDGFKKKTLCIFVEDNGELISLENCKNFWRADVSFNNSCTKVQNFIGLPTVGEHSPLTDRAVAAYNGKLRLEIKQKKLRTVDVATPCNYR